MVEEGESVNITCKFNHPYSMGLYLRRTSAKTSVVLYADGTGKRVSDDYKGRIEHCKLQNTTIMTLQHLLQNDSDVYECEVALLINGVPRTAKGKGTFLAVKGMCWF